MLAYLRYRRVPYEFLMSDQAERKGSQDLRSPFFQPSIPWC